MGFRSAAATVTLLASLFTGGVAQAQTFLAYGVYGKMLLKMGPAYPVNGNPPMEVTGLQTGEGMVGIDYNAATDQLYVVTDQNKIYTVDRTSAMATQVGTNPFADSSTHVVVHLKSSQAQAKREYLPAATVICGSALNRARLLPTRQGLPMQTVMHTRPMCL